MMSAHVDLSSVRAVLSGSGKDMMSEPLFTDAVLELDRDHPPSLNLLYLGTATYDLVSHRERNTAALAARGVRISVLDVACQTEPEDQVRKAIGAAVWATGLEPEEISLTVPEQQASPSLARLGLAKPQTTPNSHARGLVV
jgi:hypothetical protein